MLDFFVGSAFYARFLQGGMGVGARVLEGYISMYTCRYSCVRVLPSRVHGMQESLPGCPQSGGTDCDL